MSWKGTFGDVNSPRPDRIAARWCWYKRQCRKLPNQNLILWKSFLLSQAAAPNNTLKSYSPWESMGLHGSPWLEASEDVRKYALYKVLKFPQPLVFDRSHSSCNQPNTSSCGMLWMKTQRNPALNRQPPWRWNWWLLSSFLRWAAGSLENFQLWCWEPLSFYLHFCWVWRKGNDPDISQCRYMLADDNIFRSYLTNEYKNGANLWTFRETAPVSGEDVLSS